MTTLFTTMRKLGVPFLLLANVAAFAVLATARPSKADPMDFCDEDKDGDTVWGCDCFRGGPWLPTECAKAGKAYHCLDGTRCIDGCEKSGPDCRIPVPE